MSKGAYSFISYPESSNIEDVVAQFLLMGADVCYALHDKDKHEDGTPKKEHYHIIAGWEKGYPTWKKFKEVCTACGAVAVSASKCIVKNIHKAVRYLTHKDNPEKYQYTDNIVKQSETWDADLYISEHTKRDNARNDKNEKKAEVCAYFLELCVEKHIYEFCTFIDYIRTKEPERFADAVQNHHFVKDYITSTRLNHKMNEEIIDLLETKDGIIKRLEDENKALRNENFKMSDELQETRNLLKIYAEMTGDNAPAIWEIGV